MTPTCTTCASYETRATEIGGRPFTAELCRRMGMVTALARMAWTRDFGLPSAQEHCGPAGRMWRSA